jgi:adiponectin receptor
MSHSERLYLLGMQMDILGVLVLMWSATVPLAHYSLACHPRLEAACHVASASLALACAVATSPRVALLAGPRLGPARAALFALFGAASFAAPLAHAAALRPADWAARAGGRGWLAATAALDGAGAAVYLLRFPERWWPRRFDLLGASHQLMHLAVLGAALAYAGAVVEAFDYSVSMEGQC